MIFFFISFNGDPASALVISAPDDIPKASHAFDFEFLASIKCYLSLSIYIQYSVFAFHIPLICANHFGARVTAIVMSL